MKFYFTPQITKFHKSPYLWLLFLFFITAKGHLEIIDTEYSVRTAIAIIEDGSMLIDPVDSNIRDRMPKVEGTNKIYSQYGIGILIIFIPIVLVAKFFANLTGMDQLMITHFFLSFYNIPFAILGLWNFRHILIALGQKKIISDFLTICLAVGTIYWKYTVTDFSEIAQCALLLCSIRAFLDYKNSTRWKFVSICLGLLISVKLLYVLLVPCFLIHVIAEDYKTQFRLKYLLQFISWLLPFAILLSVANWARYGNIFESGYGSQQEAFSFFYFMRDWKDYVFSWDRGLFTYNPILLISLLLIPKLYNKDKRLTILILSIALTLYLATASWMGWKGGVCWGNRNLMLVVPILAICWGVFSWEKIILRYSFCAILLISISIQLVGSSIKVQEWTVLSRSFRYNQEFQSPNELKGCFLLFKEKIHNSSGIYKESAFVTEYKKEIDLTSYESFKGYNFWIVHLAKLFMSKYLQLTSLLLLTLTSFLTIFLIARGYLKIERSNLKN